MRRASLAGNPRRVPVVLHHSKTGKAAAATAIGWDATTYGKNSKSLIAWARAQINIAPGDAEDERKILFACAKNNNGRKFEPIGLLFEKEVGIYTKDPDFDLQGFKEEVGLEKKSKGGRPSKNPELQEIAALIEGDSMPMYKLRFSIMNQYKLSSSSAYRVIKDCEEAGLLSLEKVGKQTFCYRSKPEDQENLL